MHRTTRSVAIAAAAAAMAVGPAGPALGHTEVGEGDLSLVVGFGTEPAYSREPNSVQVIVSRGGEPVTDLRPGDLAVEVSYGDASTTMELEPNFALGAFGEPGDYRAWFLPSEPGAYTFHITGTVDGEEVDEEVRSGPNTFSDIVDIAEVTFPTSEAPTNEELAERIERSDERITDAVARAQAAATTASDDVDSARTIALTALLVGAIGVVAGIAGIASGRRMARSG